MSQMPCITGLGLVGQLANHARNTGIASGSVGGITTPLRYDTR